MMRRTVGLVALASTGLLASAVALAPDAGGAAQPRPVVAADAHSTPSACQPKLAIVASQKLGDSTTIAGGLTHVVEADKTHAYAVGVTAQENPLLKTETFTGVLDQGEGKHWALNTDPDGSLAGKFLTSVDATSNSNVWVVGNAIEANGSEEISGVVLHKNAAGWHRVALPGSQRTELTSVATMSPKAVYLGGVTVPSGSMNKAVPVIFHFNGKKWTRTLFSGLTGEGVSAMTVAGTTVTAAMTNEGVSAVPTTGPTSTIKYLHGTSWKTLSFAPKAGLSALSGSSIHDLWAASVDSKDNATDVVFHHAKQWTHITVSDDDVNGISERRINPQGVWVAGTSTSNDQYGALDTLRSSGPAAGSIEIPADTFNFFDVDTHLLNRALAVGDSTDTDGTVRTLIEQATC